MGYFKKEIEGAAEILRIRISELSAEEAYQIKQKVMVRFTGGKKKYPLWEYLEDSVSIQDPDAWRWIEDLVPSKPVLMLFNEDQEKTILKFDSGTDVVIVLKETTAFEFYLTDINVNYLLCFNHHDFLIAAGTSVEWLEKRIKNDEN